MPKPTVQVATVFFVLLLTSKMFADVYVYKNKDGELVFRNVPTHQGFRRVIREKGLPDAPKKQDAESTTSEDAFNQPTNQPAPEEERLRQIFREAIIEQAHWNEMILSARQWEWKQDTNGDGKVTISDIPGWFEWASKYPGDWVIYQLLKERGRAAEFLELTPASYGGTLSIIISSVVFPLVFASCILLFALIAVVGEFLDIRPNGSNVERQERMRKEYAQLPDKGLWKWIFNR